MASLRFVPPTFSELELPLIAPNDNPALNGWHSPVRAETTSTGPFGMVGSLPPGLNGRLIFLGPNPVLVPNPDTYDPAEGDGMLHSFDITRGTLTEQRSRLVVTRHLVAVLNARPPEGPLSSAGPYANRALIHVAGRLLALDGLGLPYRITPELRTACVEDFDAMLASPMGTQVIVDPERGDAIFLGMDPDGPPYLRLHQVNAEGVLRDTHEIELPSFRASPALGRTEHRALLAESSLIAPPLRGDDDELQACRFEPHIAPRVGLFDLSNPDARISWSTSEPGHIHSVLSSRETVLGADALVWRTSPERSGDPAWWPPREAGYLERVAVNGIGKSCTIERLDDLELGALVADLTTAQSSRRFFYGVTARRSGSQGGQLVKYDVVTSRVEHRPLEEHLVADQPLFVRDPEGRTDEEGWLVVPVFDRSSESSALLVLDATRFTGSAEAMLTLPERLPFGLQGVFLSPSSFR